MADDTTDKNDVTMTDPVPPAPGRLWLKDSRGFSSASLTFATVAFWVTVLAYVLSIIQKIGPVEFRPFDTAACSALLLPSLMLYFGRKFTDTKFGPPGSPTV